MDVIPYFVWRKVPDNETHLDSVSSRVGSDKVTLYPSQLQQPSLECTMRADGVACCSNFDGAHLRLEGASAFHGSSGIIRYLC